MKTKAPNVELATTTARVISRLMRKAGFLMANTKDRFAWTEGFCVSRVGCSRWVSISYHVPQLRVNDREAAERRRLGWEKLGTFLSERGYVRDQTYGGYFIACRSPD